MDERKINIKGGKKGHANEELYYFSVIDGVNNSIFAIENISFVVIVDVHHLQGCK